MSRGTLILAALCASAPAAAAPAPDPPAQVPSTLLEARAPEPDEAWWTGPIAASSADTLPRGHVLIEPYLYDVRSPGGDYLGSLTYILYGLTDRLTVGVIPTIGSARSRGSASPRRVAAGDLTLQAQLRLHRAKAGDALPTFAVLIQRAVPLGRFDRLGDDPDRGVGGGVAPTTLGVNAQRVDRLPSGRALRTRVNLARSLPSRTHVLDASIYGTPAGFGGIARVRAVTTADLSVEYSATRRFTLATDLIGRWAGSGLVSGRVVTGAGRLDYVAALPGIRSFSVAPALEYSWTNSRGVLLGARWTAAAHGRPGSVTPVVALNVVL